MMVWSWIVAGLLAWFSGTWGGGTGVAARGDGWAARAGTAGSAVVEREAAVMGTVLSVRVAARNRGVALAASESAVAAVRRLEGRLSTWREDTELTRLNRSPAGHPVRMSSEILDLLTRVAELSAETGGAFDPAVGALVDAWDLRGRGRIPGSGELAAAMRSTGLGLVVLDPVEGTALRRSSGVWLDAGGFGKGAALDAALASLDAAGATRAVLDFGGQVAVLGYGAGPGIVVRVASPVSRATAVAELRIARGSVATTSSSERRRVVDGRVVGHVLDPRTGHPVPAWGSITVVAEDALTADALSTALFVLGPDAALDWARRRGVAVLALEMKPDRIKARWSHGMGERLRCVPGPAAGTVHPHCDAVTGQ